AVARRAVRSAVVRPGRPRGRAGGGGGWPRGVAPGREPGGPGRATGGGWRVPLGRGGRRHGRPFFRDPRGSRGRRPRVVPIVAAPWERRGHGGDGQVP